MVTSSMEHVVEMCPNCIKKMKVWQTLEHLTRNGILTRRRKHKCLECDHRSTTVEIPEYYLYHYLKEIGE